MKGIKNMNKIKNKLLLLICFIAISLSIGCIEQKAIDPHAKKLLLPPKNLNLLQKITILKFQKILEF